MAMPQCWAQLGAVRVLQAVLMSSSSPGLDKGKYNHRNYLQGTELTVFCSDSGVSGD